MTSLVYSHISLKTLSKKQKVDSECRSFKESWGLDYFVQENNNRPLCLICNKTVAVMKKYNIKRHYVTKHANTYEKYKSKSKKTNSQFKEVNKDLAKCIYKGK